MINNEKGKIFLKVGNIEVCGIIYKITNTINGKCYIGQTVNDFNRRYCYGGNSPIERVYKYHKHCKENGFSYNNHLLNSIEKYGIENFIVDVYFDTALSIEELNEKEEYYINFYKSAERNYGYNSRLGGGNRKTKNSYVIYDDYVDILIVDKNKNEYHCYVDVEDFDLVKDKKWYYEKNKGAKNRMLNRLMPYLILNHNDSHSYIIHLDGNKLNNRKDNLKIRYFVENGKIFYRERTKLYEVYVGGKYLKSFKDKKEAEDFKNKEIEMYINKLKKEDNNE